MAYYNGIGIDTIESITSGKIIGTASVASHYDISGNDNVISQTTSTMQCTFDSELGTWSWDGTAQKADVVLPEYCPYVYPDSVSVVHDIESVTDEVLGDVYEFDGTLTGLAGGNGAELSISDSILQIYNNGTTTYSYVHKSLIAEIGNIYHVEVESVNPAYSWYVQTIGGYGVVTKSNYDTAKSLFLVATTANISFRIVFRGETGNSFYISKFTAKQVLSGTPVGTSTLKLGQTTINTLTPQTLYGLAAFSRTPTTLEQARIALWYASLDPVQRQINDVTASVENAREWLDSIYVGEGTSDSMDSIYTALITAWPELGA